MKQHFSSYLAVLVASGSLTLSLFADSKPHSAPGIERMQFLTDQSALVPGGTLTVGLVVSPAPDHHTYWKGPGIVGVATLIEWDLPKGFEAGPILWPVPEKVDMVGITANGYREETILLTEIRIPEDLPIGEYTFTGKTAWMACSTSCNPGVADLSFTLPCDPEKYANPAKPDVVKLFEEIRSQIPSSAPEDWAAKIQMKGTSAIQLTLSIPGMTQEQAEAAEFYCHDMQVNSDELTEVTWIDSATGTFEMKFVRPDFAPRDPEIFSGVLVSENVWPGTKRKDVEVSVAWQKDSFPDE